MDATKRSLRHNPELLYRVRGMQMRLLSLLPRRREVAAPVRDDIARFAHLFAGSAERFRSLVEPWRHEFDWPVGRVNNGSFESVDVELYHAVLRANDPDLVIEIGGGNSSAFAADVLDDAERLVVIDPTPRARLPAAVRHLACLVEDVELEFFERLGAGDVLFIDSSHTTREARYHVAEILPRLAPGVFIHHHDIFFPYDRAYLKDGATYGEQDVVLTHYLTEPDTYEVLTGAAWMRYEAPEVIDELVDSYRWQPARIPGSLWARKTA